MALIPWEVSHRREDRIEPHLLGGILARGGWTHTSHPVSLYYLTQIPLTSSDSFSLVECIVPVSRGLGYGLVLYVPSPG